MKKIKDHVSLNGKFEVITASMFRSFPGEVFESVALGKTFLITKNEKPIAVISKPPGSTLSLQIARNGEWKYSL